MDVKAFKDQTKALGVKWGTPYGYRGLLKETAIPNKWRINISDNGLEQEIIKLQSKSVPLNEIFLKPKLIGETYLMYKRYNLRAGNEWVSLYGILQSSEIDFEDFQYCYLVTNDSDDILISEGRIDYSEKINWKHRNPEVTEEYKEKQKIAFLEEFFRGKIWQGCYALDLSYLIGESGSVFMNWNSNPFQKN